jgi:RNA polymerase sigma-70 factor (ECF subfamily)
MEVKAVKYHNFHPELIEKSKAGNQEAQFEIYKCYYKTMYNTSLRIVNNTAEAEDIMQESFLSAFTKLNTYKGEASFGTWLKKIVINKSIDLVKMRKIDYEQINDKHSETVEEQTIADTEELNDKINRIKKAITKLPGRYRIIFSLYMLEGYDHKEIGYILDINEATSRSQLARAKRKLQNILKQ